MRRRLLHTPMSFFGSRKHGRAYAQLQSEGIDFGVPEGAPLAEVLALVAEGSISYSKGVAALKRDRLVRLELANARLGPAAARVLEEYLASRGSQVHTLLLRRVSFETPEAFSRLCNGVAQSKQLETIAVTHSGLSDSQADKLIGAARTGRSPVIEVDLSHNDLASPVECIEKLKHLTKLEKLNLSGNHLLCGVTLANALRAHWPSMTEVLLLRTGIHGGDAQALLDAAAEGSARFAEYAGPRVVSLA